jgi:hypothetical protein
MRKLSIVLSQVGHGAAIVLGSAFSSIEDAPFAHQRESVRLDPHFVRDEIAFAPSESKLTHYISSPPCVK